MPTVSSKSGPSPDPLTLFHLVSPSYKTLRHPPNSQKPLGLASHSILHHLETASLQQHSCPHAPLSTAYSPERSYAPRLPPLLIHSCITPRSCGTWTSTSSSFPQRQHRRRSPAGSGVYKETKHTAALKELRNHQHRPHRRQDSSVNPPFCSPSRQYEAASHRLLRLGYIFNDQTTISKKLPTRYIRPWKTRFGSGRPDTGVYQRRSTQVRRSPLARA